MNALFKALCAFGPFIKMIERFINWMSHELLLIRIQQMRKQMEEAIALSKDMKDTSKIDEAFKGDSDV